MLIFMPTRLVAAQPDLGKTILVELSGLVGLCAPGLRWRLMGVGGMRGSGVVEDEQGAVGRVGGGATGWGW
ncbi:cell wall shape-determining protein [Escherichia coli]|nr:cell wall shape-determining protein [Escherichia coli]